MLNVENLRFSYPDGREALKGLNFRLAPGDFAALIGPNGSGKSTALKVISGVLESKGSVFSDSCTMDGQDLFALSQWERARAISYLGPEFSTEFPMTAGESVMLARTSTGRGFFESFTKSDHEKVEQAMERCACSALKDRDLRRLSSGERQLVNLARAVAQGSKVLFLDEALSQMDLHHQAKAGRLLEALSSEGFAIVLVSHDLALASEWAKIAIGMREGAIVAQGPMKQVLNSELMKKLYPGENWMVAPSPASGAPRVYFGSR